MADITDPLIIKWSNEELRPLSEILASLNVVLDDFILAYNTGVSAAMAANDGADILDDGRAADGISVMTKNDMVNFVTQCLTIQTQFNGGGVMDVITKPNVRAVPVGF